MYCKSLSLFLVSLLVGCGGGDSEDSNNPSKAPNSATKHTLSIMAKYKDGCGNKTVATDAALLIHNSDYSNKEIIYADASGRLTYTTESSNQTISIVMRGEKEEVNGIKPISLVTYIDYPVIDMGNFYQHIDSIVACQCETFDLKINIPNRINDISNTEISGTEDEGEIDNNLGYTNFSGLLACQNSTGEWPLISTVSNYTFPEQSFAALIPDISSTTEINAIIEGTQVDINASDYEAVRQVSTIIDGKYRLRNYAYTPSMNVYGFETESTDFYSLSTYKFEQLYDFQEVDFAYTVAYSAENAISLNKTFDLVLPEVNYNLLYAILISESDQYDLSSVPNMDYLTVGIEATYNDKTVLDWTVFAPISGQVPTIENIDLSAFIPEGVLDTSVDSILMFVELRGYGGIDGYQDYMNSKSERNVENSISDKWSTVESVYFEMATSNLNTSSLSLASRSSKITEQQKISEATNKIVEKIF